MVVNTNTPKTKPPRPVDVDLWQVVRKMVDDVDKPKPQNKEFFGTIRRVLGQSFSCFYGDETQEKLRLQGNLPTESKSMPTYALVEVPYFTSKKPGYEINLGPPDAYWEAIISEDWEYNFLTVDISGLGDKALKSKGFHIIFVFDEDFKNPKFVRMPSFKDNPIFPKVKKKPKPKQKRRVKAKAKAAKAPPRISGYTAAVAATKLLHGDPSGVIALTTDWLQGGK